MSKFSLEVLNTCVFPFVPTEDPDVVLGAAFGEDIALTRIHEGLLVSHVDPIIGAVNQIGWLAVHIACNDIATSGARPRWILVLTLIPDPQDHTLLKTITAEVGQAAKETGVTVIGGHSGYSTSLSRPLVAVTALGTLPEGQKPVLSSGAEPGDHILVTKGIGLEGTAILAGDFSETARNLELSTVDLQEAHDLFKGVSIVPEALLLADAGATAMHDVTRGGLLETLMEIAQCSKVGLKIDHARIPIPQIVTRFARAFAFDPLKMISSGTLVAAIPEAALAEAKNRLSRAQITFADIGQAVEGQGLALELNDRVTHYTESHPEADELARMWEIYSRDGVQ